VYEIYHLLAGNIQNMDDPETKEKVLREIVEKYSWKAPETSVSELRTRISK